MLRPVRQPLRRLFVRSTGLAATALVTHLALAESPLPSWVTAKPGPETQTQRSAKDRGVNPCMSPDPGFGIYGEWHRDVTLGQYLMPVRGGVRKDGAFDVMFHFHGHEPVRKEWVSVMDGAVLAAIDLGIGSGAYESAFAAPDVFVQYLRSVEAAVQRRSGNPRAHARHIGLSAWSAGYGAIQRILEQPVAARIDTVILLDGLHAGYVDGHVDGRQIASFIAFARAAASGQKLMFVSHSSIIPPGYASTTETAHWLVWSVGGKRMPARRNSPEVMGLELISRFDRKDFHVRGYLGNDKMDHCAHIGLFRDVLKVHVAPRWKSPRGRGEKSQDLAVDGHPSNPASKRPGQLKT